MNYRHLFHAGNFADVLKHVVLLRLLAGMQAKDRGFLFLDTHAGRGAYDLAASAGGLSKPRDPEWPEGVGRLWSRSDLPPAVADYLAVVRAFDLEARERLGAGENGASVGPRFYPGSPHLARARLREQDRAVFCERQAEEAKALEAEFAGLRRVSAQALDGYSAVRAFLPPPERRAVVLIDPPFEAQDEWARVVEAVERGLARLPAGVFAVWYPLTARARVDAFYRELLGIKALPPCCTVELLIGGEGAGLKVWGCGVLVINPPWQAAGDLETAARWLGAVLGQAPGARGGLHWLVPER